MTLSDAKRQARRREKLKGRRKDSFSGVGNPRMKPYGSRQCWVRGVRHITPRRPLIPFAQQSPAKRKRRRVDPVQEKNSEIFERNIAKVRSRLAGGKKPSEIAAWLNSLGFVGSGATLNGLLNVHGIRRG